MLIAGIFSALPSIIRVAAWIVAVVFGAVMVRNGGEKPERCFLAGACLMLASSLIASVAAGLMPWLGIKLAETADTITEINSILFVIHTVNSLIALAGIVLLVYAFWRRFSNPPAALTPY
jgi:hypothetical protein